MLYRTQFPIKQKMAPSCKRTKPRTVTTCYMVLWRKTAVPLTEKPNSSGSRSPPCHGLRGWRLPLPAYLVPVTGEHPVPAYCPAFRAGMRKRKKFSGQLGSDVQAVSTGTGSHLPGSLLVSLKLPAALPNVLDANPGDALTLEYCLTVFVIVFLYLIFQNCNPL